MQKAKWLSEEALQIAVKRREVKSKVEKALQMAVKRKEVKSKGEHLNAEFQRIVGEIRKPSSAIKAKKWKKTTE